MKKRKSLSRRLFLGQCAAAPFVISQLGGVQSCRAEDAIPEPTPSDSPETGKPYAGWKEGDLDLHFIYTGLSESCYHIFPDGTSILIDTGDIPQQGGIPILPNNTKRPGEWVARYIKRVNPAGDHVDYMMCSHFHGDHCGNEKFGAGWTSGRGEDYFLSGLAQVAEFIHFDEVFDRSYPDYTSPVTAMRQGEIRNWLKFVQYQEKANGLKRTPFVVGRGNQIVLKKSPDKFKGQFQVLNVCGNGTVCTEAPKPEDEFNPNVQLATENQFLKYPHNDRPGANENLFSIGFRLSYGKFRFYTAGDFSGVVKDNDGNDIGYEAMAGKTVGKVHVCKANHHGYIDAMRPEFVKELQAHVYIQNVWHRAQVNMKTLPSMTSQELYQGDRLICPTVYNPNDIKLINEQSWTNEIVKRGGHVVVKAYDGGTKYKVYYLTANDESMIVKAVYGPWEC
ncbi:MAG: hypothetical protein IJQ39_07755 [Thermoguttaceae bacterium]|nr:hypothetical protein [Thermoguttaceae bacterium]